MASFQVFVTEDAEGDLNEIVEYVERRDSAGAADALFQRIKKTVLALERTPRRGRVVPELRRAGVTDYREILMAPYRILYWISEEQIYVLAILDGRRELTDILFQRLVR